MNVVKKNGMLSFRSRSAHFFHIHVKYMLIWSWKKNWKHFSELIIVLLRDTNEIYSKNMDAMNQQKNTNAHTNRKKTKSIVRHQNHLWQWLKITTKLVVAACCIPSGNQLNTKVQHTKFSDPTWFQTLCESCNFFCFFNLLFCL